MIVIFGLWAVSVACRPRPVDLGPRFVWLPVVGLLVVVRRRGPRVDRSGARGVQRGAAPGGRRDRRLRRQRDRRVRATGRPDHADDRPRSRGRLRPGHPPAVARAGMAERGPDGGRRLEHERGRCRRWLTLVARIRSRRRTRTSWAGSSPSRCCSLRALGGEPIGASRSAGRARAWGRPSVPDLLARGLARFRRRAPRRPRHARGPRRPGGPPGLGECGRRHGRSSGAVLAVPFAAQLGARATITGPGRDGDAVDRRAVRADRCRRWRSSPTTAPRDRARVAPAGDRRTRAELSPSPTSLPTWSRSSRRPRPGSSGSPVTSSLRSPRGWHSSGSARGGRGRWPGPLRRWRRSRSSACSTSTRGDRPPAERGRGSCWGCGSSRIAEPWRRRRTTATDTSATGAAATLAPR